ncbi:MAG: hypothetical protein IJK41_05325 [Muribaculaceae bacterium]|nr:hypothetical protein [Muribaculaceae bacterium]
MKDTSYNSIDAVLVENARRRAALDGEHYDPIKGEGCWGERVEAGGCLVPKKVLDDNPLYAMMEPLQQERLRIVEDFEFWCARCVKIHDKMSCRSVPFVLNRPQRKLLAVMEEQRTAGQPIRVILLKARQWGASTMVQMYMAWMQLVRHKGWNSVICCHKQSTSKAIKRMYNLMIEHYPKDMLDDGAQDHPLRFTKLEGQPNVQQIEARECLLITASSRSEDAVRGYDISMAHLSEVAFWQESKMHNPDDVLRSVCGSVTLKPESVIVLESTADGVGTYFHDEWLRATRGTSDKVPVFVPWYEIGIYSREVEDVQALWDAMDNYERALWDDGRTLEQIYWYHCKRSEQREHALMMSEFPSSASEAFATSGRHVFSREELDRLAKGCRAPLAVGEVQGAAMSGHRAKENVRFYESSAGQLKVWDMPVTRSPSPVRYMAVVDVGGRSDGSDYSVVAVWRVGDEFNKPAIVAQWRGHIDHDQLAVKAMQIAVFYNKALLVVESNTLTNEAARAGESDYILERLKQLYGNVYQRSRNKLGFHTNVKTKSMSVAELVAGVREGSYIERDIEAVNEMRCYEERNRSFSAAKGKHDDILMTRAIGLYLMRSENLFSQEQTPDPSSMSCDAFLY